MGRFRLNPFRRREPAERQITTISDYAQSFGYAGNTYMYPTGDPGVIQTHGKNHISPPSPDFMGNVVTQRRNSVVAACLDIRQSVFSATRFQWQRLNEGRPSEMFGDGALRLLERPWPGGTTQDLLALMIQDADLSGNSYWVILDGRLVRLRPDWVDVVLAPRLRPDFTEYPKERNSVVGYEAIGYLYTEGGGQSGQNSTVFFPDEIAHFMPRPDPLAPWRGMSWLTPLVRSEIRSDELMSEHKARFFENAATPNMVIRLDRSVSPEAFEKFQAAGDASHKGVENAYKTLYVGGGADVTVVGADFQQMAFTDVQNAGETRIAAAAGVPPVIVGLSEGLESATYSNYAQARRRFADGTIHPLWQNAAGSLEHLIREPGKSSAIRLWYDSRDVPFLREDQKDASEIQQTQAVTIKSYVDAGFTPESAVAAVEAGDMTLLVHSGLVSVQLFVPGTERPKYTPENGGAKPTTEEPT